MSPQRETIRRIVDLAEQIEADIRKKTLQPGDKYLSTIDTARMLRVDTTIANHALQLMVKRRILTRRQRVGTYIDEGLNSGGILSHEDAMIKTVHFMLSDPEIKDEGLFDSQLMFGIQSEIPGADVQLHSAQSPKNADTVSRIIGKALRSSTPEGFILLGTDLPAQREFAASGLPCVIMGHPYPSVQGLPFIDTNQYQEMRLLADHLLRQGHRKIIVLSRRRMLPGDNAAFDAALDAIVAAGLPATSLVLRFLPQEANTVQHELTTLIRDILDHGEVPGVIARTPPMVDFAAATINSLDLSPQQKITITSPVLDDLNEQGFATIKAALTWHQQGALAARMLLQQSQGHRPDPFHKLIDVHLVSPR